jgi:hypothetical protein
MLDVRDARAASIAERPALRVHQISAIRENHGQAGIGVSAPRNAPARAL